MSSGSFWQRSVRAQALLGLYTLLSLSACRTEQTLDLAITDVTVIDAPRGTRERRTVLIRGEQIVDVVESGRRGYRARATIDGSGRFLIPGLWDMHVHLSYEPDLTDAMAELFLRHGVTSVRDTGGLVRKMKPILEQWRAAGARAPRAYWSGPLLDGERVVYDGDSRPEIGVSNPTPEAAAASVAELADLGVDFIKIYELVSPEVFRALAKAAAERELPIAAHVPLSMTVADAAPRLGSMEHLRNIELSCAADADRLLEERLLLLNDPDAPSGYALRSNLHTAQRSAAITDYDASTCATVVESLRGTIQVPTLRLNTFARFPVHQRPDWWEALNTLPEPTRSRWQSAGENLKGREAQDPGFANWSVRLVGHLHEAGIPVGAGTDTPIGLAIPGESLHSELERLVEAGLEPLDALAAATSRPAEFFSLEERLGSIEPGMLADLVLLEENPLENIRNTRTIVQVIVRGVPFQGRDSGAAQ